MPHIDDHHNATAPPGVRPDQAGTPVSRHPSWCSPQHCFLTEDGVRVHEQQPVRWEECEVRFESRLLFPEGEHPPATYLQLSIDNLLPTWRCVDAFLPIAAARRLRDQLTSHLDAAHSGPSAQAAAGQGELAPRGGGPPAAGRECLPEYVGEVVRESAE
ncbi:MAG: hypothetical protein ACRDRH_17915 [Pseudonocardia sp.]